MEKSFVKTSQTIKDIVNSKNLTTILYLAFSGCSLQQSKLCDLMNVNKANMANYFKKLEKEAGLLCEQKTTNTRKDGLGIDRRCKSYTINYSGEGMLDLLIIGYSGFNKTMSESSYLELKKSIGILLEFKEMEELLKNAYNFQNPERFKEVHDDYCGSWYWFAVKSFLQVNSSKKSNLSIEPPEFIYNKKSYTKADKKFFGKMIEELNIDKSIDIVLTPATLIIEKLIPDTESKFVGTLFFLNKNHPKFALKLKELWHPYITAREQLNDLCFTELMKPLE